MKFVYRSNIAAGLSLAVLLVLASPLTATAHQSTADDSTENSSAQLESQTHSNQQTADDSSLHGRAAQLLKEKRQNHKEHSQAQRQEACQQHKDAIDSRFEALGDKSGRYLNGFDNIFTKLQAYKTKKQLDVANYDQLVADVTAKQSAATAAVTALNEQSGPKIDCSVNDPAASVAAVKTATKDAREALQAYRASLKTLAKALHDAKKAAHGADTTNTTTESEGN